MKKPSVRTPEILAASLQEAIALNDFPRAEALLREHNAALWSQMSATFEADDPAKAWECARRAFDVAPKRLKRPNARRLFALSCRLRIRTMLPEVLTYLSTSPDQVEAEHAGRLLQGVTAWDHLATKDVAIPTPPKQPAEQSIPGKVLVVLEDAKLANGHNVDIPDLPGVLGHLTRYGVAHAVTVVTQRTGDNLDPTNMLQRATEHIESIVRRERPSVIHAVGSVWVGVPTVKVGRTLGIPVAFQLNEFVLDQSGDRTDDLDWFLSGGYDAIRRLESTAICHADAVICPSERIKSALIERGIPEDKITLIPPSVDVSHELTATGHIQTLGIIGVGADLLRNLLQVAAILIDQGRKLRILVINGAAFDQRTKNVIDDLELTADVSFSNAKDAATSITVDVAVVASSVTLDTDIQAHRHLLELMAGETAIVITGESSDIIQDGENGLYCASTRIEDLLATVGSVLTDPARRAELGASARSWVIANRSAGHTAATLHSLYRSLPTGDRVPKLIRPESHDERLWWKLQKPLERKRQASILDYAWHGHVLDLGTRNGIIAAQIAVTHAPEFIIGIDPDAAALTDAQQIVASNGITSAALEFVVALGEDLPFADRTFDGVIVTQVLEHVEQPERILKEVVRTLKPDGSVLVGVPGYGTMPPGTTVGHVQDFTVAEMLQLIDTAGLDLVEHRTVDVREYYFARLPDHGMLQGVHLK